MTRPRSTQVCLDETPYYHCMSRCVRRAFLCGYDEKTKTNYDYRRKWIENKILELSQHFCISVPAYSVMSNHYHVILYVDRDKALALSNKEVAKRWVKIYKPDSLIIDFLNGVKYEKEEKKRLKKRLKEIRERLYSISWFMRVINQYISATCNEEDEVTGAFWASRFQSKALLSDAAVMACMAYVDLNPIRANMAKTIEDSAFTSIKKRINGNEDKEKPIVFIGMDESDEKPDIDIKLGDYINLVKWTAENIHKENIKQGKKTNTMMAVLENNKIPPDYWLMVCERFEDLFGNTAGKVIDSLRANLVFGTNRMKKLKNIKKKYG